jgi:hypothetical protein
MTMTRQHFALIAEVIKDAQSEFTSALGDEHGQMAQEIISTLFASELRQTNPNFNRDRFLRACGVDL